MSSQLVIIALFAACVRARVVISVDVGTESTRAAVFDASGTKLASHISQTKTYHPHAGHAEQQPDDWWDGLGEAVRGALASSNLPASEVAALCLAATSCTVMALDSGNQPLRPALLWMDSRSAPQAVEIMEKGKGDTALSVNVAGEGPISAEWMLPKALWLKQCEPETWAKAATICECQDWLQWKCTGRLAAGGCNVATRWHCDGAAACAPPSSAATGFGGRPLSLLARVGLDDLAAKWPKECVAMGAVQGRLTAEAAAHLGLKEGTPLAQGGADAYVGLVGLGAATMPGAVGLITGSSHLHLAIVDASAATCARGAWGAYQGAPLSHQAMAEGGQSSTGAALQWARRLFSSAPAGNAVEGNDGYVDATLLSLQALDEEAALVPIGCEGLSALETFQGSRTPVTDPFARGALTGLTLKHSRAHVWRALLEAICLGTRAALQGLAAATSNRPTALLLAGGASRSPLWLQMHADAAGLPVIVGECPDAPVLGGAILAAALPTSLHGDPGEQEHVEQSERSGGGSSSPRAAIARATEAMVRHERRIEPEPSAATAFAALYTRRYVHVAPTLAPLSRRASLPLRPLPPRRRATRLPLTMQHSGRGAVVQPSLLAADMGALGAAARELSAAGATWTHVDVADGSAIAGRQLTSLGPSSLTAVRAAAPSLLMDVHLYTLDPEAHVASIAAAGARRITFQIEALEGSPPQRARDLVASIQAAGCLVGVCLAPDTPIAAIEPLLREGEVDLVNVLAVLPGVGGQSFRHETLERVKALRVSFPDLPYLMVDGGIDGTTAPLAAAAGANAIVSGSYLFRAPPGGLADRLATLEAALVEHGE